MPTTYDTLTGLRAVDLRGLLLITRSRRMRQMIRFVLLERGHRL